MGRKKKHAEETPPEDVPEPGAAASSGASDDGPLPEDLDDAEEEEDPEEEEPEPKPKRVSKAPDPAKPVDPRAELRKRLGEPDPFPGAIIDPQTGRVENAPPGWDPKRRPPQKP